MRNLVRKNALAANGWAGGRLLKSSERWFAIAGTIAMTAVAIAGFAVAIYAAWLFHDMPDGGELADFHPVTSARVFAWDGTLIGEYGQERRIYVPYDRIPPKLAEAFLAAEDRNFFQHNGVDVGGMSRAMGKNVFNFLTGKRFEGGSTITQQVAKNLLLGNERTLGRKLKEVIMARRLEASLSKEQILELYLNDIYLGYRSYGIGAAAFNYFGKSVDELTLAQMAYLGALPKGPENYRPSNHKAEAIARRNWVLAEMARDGFCTKAEAEAAMQEDLVIQAKPERAKYHDADYFVGEVELRAKKLEGDNIYTEGFYIKTTLDPRLQTLAREALMDGLETYDRRHGWRGAWANVSLAGDWVQQAEDAYERLDDKLKMPSERPDWQIAAVDKGGAIRLAQGGTGTIRAADVSWASGGRGLKTGDLVYVEPDTPAGVYRLKQVPAVNGALVAVDPYTGRIEALVGGYSYSLSKFNRATQAYRQPGSSIKPFVYAAALQNDFTPASIIDDSPVSMMGGDGKMWNPENYEHDFLGPQPMRRGIELSRNLMTIHLAEKVGIQTIVKKINDYGVTDNVLPAEMSMVLGAGEVAPYRLATSYSIFVNGGRKVKPHLIDEIQDRDGTVVYKADERACPAVCTGAFDGLQSPRLMPQGEQVMDDITSYQINSFLQGVTIRGTAAAARSLGFPVGGKTGTTNDFRSAWFVGFDTEMVVGVFVGFDDNRSLGEHETGAVAALPIWIDFMAQAHKGKPVKDFTKPREAVFVSVRGIEEAFKPGTEPKYTDSGPSDADEPKPYLGLWKDGDDDAPPSDDPPIDEAPPPKKPVADDGDNGF